MFLSTSQKCGFFYDFQYSFSFSLSTAYPVTVKYDRVFRPFNRSVLLEMWYLIQTKLSTGFGILVFFRNAIGIEFQVGCFALFCFFSVKDDFQWFCMESFRKNIQLILVYVKAPLLIQHFSCYTLMPFLLIISLTFLFVLMILLSVLSVIRHLICGNNQSWPLNLNPAHGTLWSAFGSVLLVLMLEKLNLFIQPVQ